MVTDIFQNIEKKMRTSVNVLKHDLATVRTGHASPGLIEHIKVDYAGVPTPLNQIAGISAPEVRLLVIQPWDPTSIKKIEEAILKSDLGLNPHNDGRLIRLNVPPLSEERRQELIKVVRRKVEEDKVAIRNIRHQAIDELKKLEKNKEISQDELRRSQDRLQKLTDSFIVEAEKLGQSKETELMEV